LRYDEEDLIYVTGDSGSGKSTFLRLFGSELQKEARKCVNFSDVQVDKDDVVIDRLGSSQEEAMTLLSVVGLSEAFVMLRKFKELSEGQKYRFKLAKMIAQDGDAYLIDEFGATLDREMARVLAYCIQKWARRNRKMVVVATTHKDLIDDFNPNVVIDKKFGQTTEVRHYYVHPQQLSLVDEMQIEQATKEDYEYLKGFHYLQGNPAAVKHRFKLTYRGETIGIIVYTLSFRALHYRNQLFPEYKNNIQRVNSEILRISRVIIHPKFRGVGLAQVLIRLTLPQVNARIVECVAAMAKYNPFFEKAGMTLAGVIEPQPDQKKLLAFIEGANGKISLLHNKALCKAFLNDLNAVQMGQLQKILEQNISDMGGSSPGRMNRLRKNMSEGNFSETLINLLPVERCYLYWVNPAHREQKCGG
jgi:ABC-type lipoprotein export system ATPase subunit/GNAT superfamily N-acetyltransferase